MTRSPEFIDPEGESWALYGVRNARGDPGRVAAGGGTSGVGRAGIAPSREPTLSRSLTRRAQDTLLGIEICPSVASDLW
jgi:hypothetical protein